MSKYQKHIRSIIAQQEKDDVLKSMTPEQIEIVTKNMKVSSSQETPAPAASQDRDETIPAGQHPFEMLVDSLMVKYNLDRVSALKKATREHPEKHRAYIQHFNPHKKI
jgi:hypothetical protein